MSKVLRADVVIVGGGLLGLSTAWRLRGRRDVLVLEQDTVGNARGGSHGPTRIFRLGYTDPHYVDLAQRAAEWWRVLEADAGARLLQRTPQLTFGPGADAVFTALVEAGAPAERITAAAIEQRFPAFAGRGDAVLETASAVIAADTTLATLRDRAGAELREHVRVEHVDARHVETATETIEARAVVVCAGPWSRSLVPGIPTTTTLEHAGYVRAGAGLPIFIDFTEPAVYGLPTPARTCTRSPCTTVVRQSIPRVSSPRTRPRLRRWNTRSNAGSPMPSSCESTYARTTTPPMTSSS